MRAAARITVSLLLLSAAAFACYQVDVPSVKLRSNYLTGVVTLDGKPVPGATLYLIKPTITQNRFLVEAEPKALNSTKTAKDGSFMLGRLEPGRYILRMKGPSYEWLKVEIISPGTASYQKLAWKFYADWCNSASAYE